MVKLGDAFVSLDSVELIAPARDGSGYSVFLACGRIINLRNVTEIDVIQVLNGAGSPDVLAEYTESDSAAAV